VQRQRLVAKISRALDGLEGKRVGVLGLAFKPNTDDVRESPALFVCRELAMAGARVAAYDPVAAVAAADALQHDRHLVTFAADAYAAAEDADAIVIMTEWNEFRGLDLERLRSVMSTPRIIDARNVLDPAQARLQGFDYVGTGRGQRQVPEAVAR
jgi:UDPglucose 6-dehydrogenase